MRAFYPSAGLTGQEVAVIRITELPLPLDYTPDALRQAIVKRLGIARRRPARFHAVQAQLRRAQEEQRHHVHLHRRCRRCATRRRCSSASRSDRAGAAVAPDTTYHPVAQAPADAARSGRWSSASVPAACSPRCCWRRWASSPSCWSAAATCAGARRTPGRCGARTSLTPESNVQFGEGGAGLFSDGKLYSQIKDPKFYGRKVMHEFVRAGAPEEILYVSKPHIGTFRLTGVVATMREEIIALGGEVRFESKVTDLLIENGQIEGVTLASGETLHSRHVVLALGHSSRDTLPHAASSAACSSRPSPSRMGFRIEHPQSLIDRGAPRAIRRPSGARRRRLQAGASREQRPRRSTASACVRAAPWSRRLPSRSAWSPMA